MCTIREQFAPEAQEIELRQRRANLTKIRRHPPTFRQQCSCVKSQCPQTRSPFVPRQLFGYGGFLGLLTVATLMPEVEP